MARAGRSGAERETRLKGMEGSWGNEVVETVSADIYFRTQEFFFFFRRMKDRFLVGKGLRMRRGVLWGEERLGHVYQQIAKSQERRRV